MSWLNRAQQHEQACIKFMRDLIHIPSESGQEGGVAARIKEEMERLNFDRAWIDDYGNVIGKIGNGPTRLLFDSHIDTVGIGNLDQWEFDPYEGKLEDGYIYGRGACDNHNGTVPQVFGAALLKESKEILDQFTIYVVGTVQEEDCDGLALRYILEESVGPVDFICLGEATDLKIYRGHRGRMEIEVATTGVSCHGSAPSRGKNAIYRMGQLVGEIEQLNERLLVDDFLGKGTCAVTYIECDTPSLCAVPDGCRIHVDRRLTRGEDKELAVKEIMELPSFNSDYMSIKIKSYDTPSYTGKVLETEKYYPTWTLSLEHQLVQAGVKAASAVDGKTPEVSRWVFSTNGVSSMGQLNIPTIGYGPGREEESHSIMDRIKIADMVYATAFYAALPEALLEKKA
ncbi:MAG: YgeY family selenium metabolism-linked hydrolase [Bdellovibrionales bacterium]|jgi:putative selenium metabolism hydrolase|nr:YgeY family selenium metabolism-linked hydrolase [Bdellovibrionales bacterium]MBT3526174.1 YgeY family selenium metabolism-linked hydrolase [Bdellovibrionales bacterium]MBT7668415.1 YgeY family selenium metabolism-linked hydrolase [Bdellovibrionales bacterium]MBT7766095.1 YgeY family selenium metabolism-linked hydrolase [Bdellovibrionales bacterium]